MNSEKYADKELTGFPAILRKYGRFHWHKTPPWFHKIARDYTRVYVEGGLRHSWSDNWAWDLIHSRRWNGLFDHWGSTEDGLLVTMPYCDSMEDARNFANILGLEITDASGGPAPYGFGTYLYEFRVTDRRLGKLDVLNGKAGVLNKYPDWRDGWVPSKFLERIERAKLTEGERYIPHHPSWLRDKTLVREALHSSQWEGLFDHWGTHTKGTVLTTMPHSDVLDQALRFAEFSGARLVSLPGDRGAWGFGTFQFDFEIFPCTPETM